MGSQSQRLYKPGALTLDDGEQDTVTSTLLSGRARQLVRLTGYRMGLEATVTTPLDEDAFRVGLFLRAIRKDYDSTPTNFIFDRTGQRPGLERHVIDFFLVSWFYEFLTSGSVRFERAFQTPWTPCDLLLPEVSSAIIGQSDVNQQLEVKAWFIIEYEWVDADLGFIAEVNLAWGRDPNDYDREVAP